MRLLSRISDAVSGSVRYRLLVLVLFPILLVMPIALGLAVYWGRSFTYDQLFIKVNTDLSVSHDIFRRIQSDYLSHLKSLADSYVFRTALEQGDQESIRKQLQELKVLEHFSYLRIADSNGSWIYETQMKGSSRLSDLFAASVSGEPRTGVEIFSAQDLEAESLILAKGVILPLVETPRARPTDRTIEDRGMMIRAVYPVRTADGRVLAVLDGGVLLNNNFNFVDAIRDLVYGKGSLPEGSIGTVTVFLDDVRISTNVPVRPGERALGTRVSNEVRTRVLDRGETWIDRAFVVNAWYISSYEPIIDFNGNRIGMLYAGFLEDPFRLALWRALATLVLMFLVLMGLSALLAIRGARLIIGPIEAMNRVVRATRAGDNARVGPVQSRDELGELAREFDSMLDLLNQRSREIQSWAIHLEEKVAERTAELESSNQDLKRTIVVLRQTRQQLVVAEKLAALGELTAGVAHEINNPTQVMLGNLDLIVQELGKNAAPVEQEIDLVIQQIYRIREIINNLLQYAKPEEYAGYLTEVDVNDVVTETLKLVQHLKNTILFEMQLGLEADCSIRISQQELQQVLVNLIVNAIQSLPVNGGTVCISTRNWENKGVAIIVEDDGEGMDAEQLGRVFNPFYTTKNQVEGTGLGLSVSYGLVRRYGGMINAESSPGNGSRFTVWLLKEPKMIEDEETITEQLRSMEEHAVKFDRVRQA